MIKRLEENRFVLPLRQQAVMDLTADQLYWLFDGIDVAAERHHLSQQYQPLVDASVPRQQGSPL